MTVRDAVTVAVGSLAVLAIGVPALIIVGNWVWHLAAESDLALLGFLLAVYVATHWIVEPFRPPWEPSLFPDRVNDWRRARYERRLDREEER